MNARRLILAMLTMFCAMAGGLLFVGASAQGALAHFDTGKAFGPEGISAGEPLGAFEDLQGITVEQSTGDVYVYDAESDGGAIFKFNAAGEPVNFSGLGSNVIEEVGEVGEGEGEIAVDDSGGPDSGDIYFASGESGTGNVLIYSAKGEPAGELKEEEGVPWGEPCGVAVDPAGNVYVGLYGSGVNKYTPKSGTHTALDYVSSLADQAVNQTCNIAADSTGDVYTTQYFGSGSVTRYEPSQFGLPEAEGTLIDETGHSLSVDPVSDDVFVDEGNAIAQYDPSGSRLDTFAETGPGALTEEDSTGVAVDHASGQVYVDGEGESAGEPDGERAVEIFGAGVVIPDVSIESESELQTTSVTLNGTVNTDSAGSATCRFEYGTSEPSENTIACSASVPSGSSPVAVSAHLSTLTAGATYHYRLAATNANGTNHSEEGTFMTPAVTPPTGPPVIKSESSERLGTNGATICGRIAPHGLETQYHFEYGASASYGTSIPIPDGKIPAGFGEQSVCANPTGLSPGTTYNYRVVASNAGSPTPVDGSDQTFTTIPAALIQASALNVSDTSATLQTQIDPQGNDTHAYFQYGTVSCAAGPSACTSVPAAPGFDVGSGEKNQSESVFLQGLIPGTVYYYRVVASNALGAADSVEHTFTTSRAGEELTLLDGREWEMVSPLNKHGATIEHIEVGVVQAAEDGGAITYLANSPIEAEPASNPTGSQVLSTRGSSGWSSKDIAISHQVATGESVGDGEDYRFFSSDLSRGLLEPFGPNTPLTPGVTGHTLYVRDSASGEVTALVNNANVPAGSKYGGDPEATKGGPEFEDATPDLSHVVLDGGSLPGELSGLYEWAAGKLELVSVMPDGEPTGEGSLGAKLHSGTVRNAVSSDGSRVFFTVGGSSERHLYMRDVPKGETLPIDVVQGGSGAGAGDLEFQDASSDGSWVFFTDAQRLTADAGAAPGSVDLYACHVVEEAGKLACRLSDLTPDAGESPGLQGEGDAVIAASEDGSYVYFVANGALAPGAGTGNCGGESTEAGQTCNLYVAQYDGSAWSRRLIGALSAADRTDWAPGLPHLTVRASPNGNWLAFMSDRSLTGYDNRDVNSGMPDEEVFLYNAASGQLTCASCDPTGEQPTGVEQAGSGGVGLVEGYETEVPGDWVAAKVPGWTPLEVGEADYQSRYLSDSGRLFFNSLDALVPQDVNGTWDVYEYEPVGVGSCELANGCVGLISGGASAEESAFLDASASGDDVFFLTSAKLSTSDTDTAFDVYDAHACSASSPCLSSPASPPACETADSCRAASAPQPAIFGAPPSATFSGQGNVVPGSGVPAVTVVKTKVQALTRAQKLAKALKACRREAKRRRAACDRRARKRYGPVKASKGSRGMARERSDGRGKAGR